MVEAVGAAAGSPRITERCGWSNASASSGSSLIENNFPLITTIPVLALLFTIQSLSAHVGLRGRHGRKEADELCQSAHPLARTVFPMTHLPA